MTDNLLKWIVIALGASLGIIAAHVVPLDGHIAKVAGIVLAVAVVTAVTGALAYLGYRLTRRAGATERASR